MKNRISKKYRRNHNGTDIASKKTFRHIVSFFVPRKSFQLTIEVQRYRKSKIQRKFKGKFPYILRGIGIFGPCLAIEMIYYEIET